MIIRKRKTFLANIEAFVNILGQLIVDDLEKGRQAAAEYLGQLFKVD